MYKNSSRWTLQISITLYYIYNPQFFYNPQFLKSKWLPHDASDPCENLLCSFDCFYFEENPLFLNLFINLISIYIFVLFSTISCLNDWEFPDNCLNLFCFSGDKKKKNSLKLQNKNLEEHKKYINSQAIEIFLNPYKIGTPGGSVVECLPLAQVLIAGS